MVDATCGLLAGVSAVRAVRCLADLEMARNDRPPFTSHAHFLGRRFLLQYVCLFLALASAADASSIFSGDGDCCCALFYMVCGRRVEAYADILVHFACVDRRYRNRANRQTWIAVCE